MGILHADFIFTDVAPGFDHITSAIGAAQSSRFGADLICYITPAEHLTLYPEDARKEPVAYRRTKRRAPCVAIFVHLVVLGYYLCVT